MIMNDLDSRHCASSCLQHALRLIAFRQIHKVLGMDALPKFTGNKRFNPRKRKATSESEAGEIEGMKQYFAVFTKLFTLYT